MTSRTPSACDDPREHGFPCFGSQKPASWVTCTKCGARLQYVSKNSQHGNRHQMGPEPHLIKLAMVDLEMSTPAASVTSDMVNGKLMETKGRMLQWAIPTSIALKCPEHGMTHAQRITPRSIPVRQVMGYPLNNVNSNSLPSRALGPEEERAVQSQPPASIIPSAKSAVAKKAPSPTPKVPAKKEKPTTPELMEIHSSDSEGPWKVTPTPSDQRGKL